MQGEEVTLTDLRVMVAPLLTTRPGDAVAAYYALEHDARRVRLHVAPAGGAPAAFVAVCQTGLDLFRPLVVTRGEGAALRDALRAALTVGRPCLFSVPVTSSDDVAAVADVASPTVSRALVLEPGALQAVVNVLVQTSRTPDGQIRALVRGRDGAPAAEAGTSWIGARYAEVWARVREGARGRGLGKSVVSAVCAEIHALGRAAIYVTGQDNGPAIGLARRLGFRDSGVAEWSGVLTLRTV